MITELLSLHSGEITLLDYLEHKRMEMDLSKPCIQWKKTTELDKAKGTTPRMRAYCRLHGLDDIPDLDIVWKKTKINYIWKVGTIITKHHSAKQKSITNNEKK